MYREEFQWPEGKKNAVMISLTLDAEYFGIAQYPEDKNAVAAVSYTHLTLPTTGLV